MEYKSVVKDYPLNKDGNFTQDCYEVKLRTLNYGYPITLFTDYSEAKFFFEYMAKNLTIKNEHVIRASMKMFEKGYGMHIYFYVAEYDHGDFEYDHGDFLGPDYEP